MIHLDEVAYQILNQYWDKKLPVDPVKIAHKMGLNVYGRGEGKDNFTFSGRFKNYDGISCIEYNVSEPLTRQRLIVAQQLGHYVLKHQDTLPAQGAFYQSNDSKDQEAYVFAKHLVMPEKLIHHYYNVVKDIEEISRVFGVSKDAIGHRLIELNYLSNITNTLKNSYKIK